MDIFGVLYLGSGGQIALLDIKWDGLTGFFFWSNFLLATIKTKIPYLYIPPLRLLINGIFSPSFWIRFLIFLDDFWMHSKTLNFFVNITNTSSISQKSSFVWKRPNKKPRHFRDLWAKALYQNHLCTLFIIKIGITMGFEYQTIIWMKVIVFQRFETIILITKKNAIWRISFVLYLYICNFYTLSSLILIFIHFL